VDARRPSLRAVPRAGPRAPPCAGRPDRGRSTASPRLRLAALTAAALIGFAANSLLCRAALRPRLLDAATFTSLRLLSGAIALVALAAMARPASPPAATLRAGSWLSAAALFAYAAAFSFAYLRIGAAVGALLLFGAVQATMLGGGLARGERPRATEWAGLAVALAGVIALVAPGLTAPDPIGAVLMIGAGVAWGVYSLRGRGRSSSVPLVTTAANFARTVPLTAALSLAALHGAHLGGRGAALAVASGALASGVGYSLWYAALPSMSATRAAIVQLSVPLLAAAGAVALLGEPLTLRIVLSAVVILGGVALAVVGRPR
jgi:drug/metabolite transporter (DMT)-like permease